jgi:hypothetical protein
MREEVSGSLILYRSDRRLMHLRFDRVLNVKMKCIYCRCGTRSLLNWSMFIATSKHVHGRSFSCFFHAVTFHVWSHTPHLPTTLRFVYLHHYSTCIFHDEFMQSLLNILHFQGGSQANVLCSWFGCMYCNIKMKLKSGNNHDYSIKRLQGWTINGRQQF